MKKALSLRLAAIGTALTLGTAAAHAALPSEVSAAVDSMGEDAASLGKIVLGAIAVVFAIKFLRKGF